MLFRRRGALATIAELQQEVATYKHAFETTAADRDRKAEEVASYQHAYETTRDNRDRIAARLAVIEGAYERAANCIGTSISKLERQHEAIERGVPPVLLITLPKSGSVFIWLALNQTLQTPMFQVATPRSRMDDALVEPQFSLFADGGMVAQHHLGPTPENIDKLRDAGVSPIIHIRDPRQAAVSWWHARQKSGSIGPLSDAEREPFLWENFIEPAVHFIEGWLNSGLDIFVSTQEEMAGNDEAHIRRLCTFLGHDGPVVLPEKSDATHFRSGLRDEWREFFSAEFQERTSDLIPDHLRAHFGWEP